MKTKLSILLFISILSISITSCKKKSDPETLTDKLTKQKWELTKTEDYDLSGNLLNTVNNTDHFYDFKVNHELQITHTSGNLLETLEWDINSDETKLFFILPDDNYTLPFKINKLEDNEMILQEIVYQPRSQITVYEVLYFTR